MPAHAETDALRGTLDRLVLETLSLAPMHGWGICSRIEQMPKGALAVHQGSVYPALQPLDNDSLTTSDRGRTDNNREARYHRTTASRRRAPQVELESWRLVSIGPEAVLRTAEP